MTTAPILVTDRLTLVGHAASDLEDCAAMWADLRVYMMIGGQPRWREDVWIRLLRSIGQWTLFGYGSWIARETATGRLIGELGLIEARRAIVPAIDATPEVGWTLAGGAHGQGFASEALAAIFVWTDPRVRRTVCIIDPANAPSIRLAARFDYVERTTGTYNDKPILILDRPAQAAASS
jgi:RimJ/RimL family protein N-acetyltransferase